MTVSDELLLAVVDGECTPEERAALEARMRTDSALAGRYAAQGALRERLAWCFDAVLEEPLPRRLLEAAAGQRRRLMPLWLAAAASFAAGLLLATFLPPANGPERMIALTNRGVAADGVLRRLLSTQLAADQSPSALLRVGVSFVSADGRYCRTFEDARRDVPIAGLACRESQDWRVAVLDASADGAGSRGTYSQAASGLSPVVSQGVAALAGGAPLDAAGEAKARASGWKVADAAKPRR